MCFLEKRWASFQKNTRQVLRHEVFFFMVAKHKKYFYIFLCLFYADFTVHSSFS